MTSDIPVRELTCDCWLPDHDHQKFHCRRRPVMTVPGGNWLGHHDVPVCLDCEDWIKNRPGVRRLR